VLSHLVTSPRIWFLGEGGGGPANGRERKTRGPGSAPGRCVDACRWPGHGVNVSGSGNATDDPKGVPFVECLDVAPASEQG
jgi:hypothetical protein